MRLVSKVFGIGVMALLVGGFALASSARAQTLDVCGDDSLTAEAALPIDPALATIECSVKAECTALGQKVSAAGNLLVCLRKANGVPAAVRRCRAAATAALVLIQFNAARADAACFINPNGGTTAPANPAS
jgi:hypothetical protein